MNLARVEYYFSDLLSKLEMRSRIDSENQDDRQKAEIFLNMGATGQSMKLFVDRNVLFVGTMNEDESTQTLSDKILDRSNMLRFGKPKKLASTKMKQHFNPSSNTALTFKNWNDWIRPADTIPSEHLGQIDEWIEILNQAMQKVSKPFGHRVGQAIRTYIANYPDFRVNYINNAFADQIEQRIIPKLRNLPCSEHREAFDEIELVIEDLKDPELKKAFNSSCDKTYFEWKGVERN